MFSPTADSNPGFYLSVYAAIVLGTAFMGVLSNGIGSWGQYRAAMWVMGRARADEKPA